MNPHTDNPKEAEGAKKCPMHLLPTAFTTQTAYALQHGAHKSGPNKTGYGEWNWRDAGIHATTYIGAIMRHLAAWQDGEDIDESGYSHIAHIAASCAIILDAQKVGMLVDDRKKTAEIRHNYTPGRSTWTEKMIKVPYDSAAHSAAYP